MRDETELFAQAEGFIGVLAQCQALGIRVVSARDGYSGWCRRTLRSA